MKIKLIYPPSCGMIVDSKRRLTPLPNGLCVLAAFLRKNNYTVFIQDMDVELNCHSLSLSSFSKRRAIAAYRSRQIEAGEYTGISDHLSNKLAEALLSDIAIKDCDIVGIGIHSEEQILTALLLAEKIKQQSGLPIIFGGAYVTLFAEFFFDKYKFIDYAITGEAEKPLISLLECLQNKRSLKNVPSLWYRDQGKTKQNKRVFFNIEQQGCPDFSSLNLKKYKRYMNGSWVRPLPYIISSGCVNNCAFCTYPALDGAWQIKSVNKVIKEITLLKQKYKRNVFFFEDANFNVSYDYVKTLCEQMIEQKINITWQARVYSNFLDKKLLEKMRQAGCVRMYWGIESASSETLKMMKKKVDLVHASKMIEYANKLGIYNTVYLIVGYPYDTPESLEKTAEFIKKNAKHIYAIDAIPLGIYPGSYLYENADKEGILIKKTQRSFFTYAYTYKETKPISEKNRALNFRARKKVMQYANKYINFRHFKFPMNLIVKYFGSPFSRERFLFFKRRARV